MDVWQFFAHFEFAVFVKAHWEEIKLLANSNFTTSLIGSLAGAFGGAWGAQKIAERAKYKERLIDEIRHTNAASTIAVGVLNSLFASKRQHIKPMKEAYDKGRLDFIEAIARKAQNVEIAVVTDFRLLAPLSCSDTALKSYAYERLMLKSRPLALIDSLGEALKTLRFNNDARNQLIVDYKNDDLFHKNSAHIYYGLPLANNQQDSRYGDLLNGMYNSTDDAIYFCMLLINDLNEHGNEMLALYKPKFGKCTIKPIELLFDKAESNGLIPDETKYTDWITGFKERPKELGKWQSLIICSKAKLFKPRIFRRG